MHLVALVESLDHVCCRYRLRAFQPFWERAGVRLEFRAWPRHWWQRLGPPATIRRADTVILQRRLPAAWELFLLRRAARRLIFDFDDAVFLRDSYANKGLHSRRRRRRFAAVVRAADAVVAGNHFLAEQARQAAPRTSVAVIPTCVDPARYPPARHLRSANGVRLVWVGSSSTLRGLELVRPLLDEVGQRVPGLKLKMICDRFLSFRHLPVLACPWAEESEAAEIAGGDIGVSWIPDDDWSRGKCGLKVLQYMAAGLPVVANPVGVHREMLRDGETGYLAETPEQWVAAIARLAADPALRWRLGQAGRQRARQEYGVAGGAARWHSLLLSPADPRQAA